MACCLPIKMGMKRQSTDTLASDKESSPGRRDPQHVSKKDQILSLYTSGVDNLEDIALMTNSRTTYVASVLQSAGLISGYFDLYTTSSQPMNAHSRFFAGKLSFKNEEAANRSVELLNRMYNQFGIARDRAGQHHALLMGLMMFNRARWTGKGREADIYRRWLLTQLNEADLRTPLEAEIEEAEHDFPAASTLESQGAEREAGQSSMNE